MSSRRYKKKDNSSNKYNRDNDRKYLPHEQPPNHPQENLPAHRTFLARSLRRNDEDMSVLVDLNRTLHKVRNNIIAAIGEEWLLDLGEGSFVLTPCERDLMVKPALDEEDSLDHEDARQEWLERLEGLAEEERNLCVDFLLRMKLRRRLLNRLSRRTMRVANAMDGEDVSAPIPPKYGDLRLNVDPEEMALAKRQWKLQAEAKERVRQFRLENPETIVPLLEVEEVEEEEEKEEEKKEEESGDGSVKKEDEDEDEDEEEKSDNKATEKEGSSDKEESEKEESDKEETSDPDLKDDSEEEESVAKKESESKDKSNDAVTTEDDDDEDDEDDEDDDDDDEEMEAQKESDLKDKSKEAATTDDDDEEDEEMEDSEAKKDSKFNDATEDEEEDEEMEDAEEDDDNKEKEETEEDEELKDSDDEEAAAAKSEKEDDSEKATKKDEKEAKAADNDDDTKEEVKAKDSDDDTKEEVKSKESTDDEEEDEKEKSDEKNEKENSAKNDTSKDVDMKDSEDGEKSDETESDDGSDDMFADAEEEEEEQEVKPEKKSVTEAKKDNENEEEVKVKEKAESEKGAEKSDKDKALDAKKGAKGEKDEEDTEKEDKSDDSDSEEETKAEDTEKEDKSDDSDAEEDAKAKEKEGTKEEKDKEDIKKEVESDDSDAGEKAKAEDKAAGTKKEVKSEESEAESNSDSDTEAKDKAKGADSDSDSDNEKEKGDKTVKEEALMKEEESGDEDKMDVDEDKSKGNEKSDEDSATDKEKSDAEDDDKSRDSNASDKESTDGDGKNKVKEEEDAPSAVKSEDGSDSEAKPDENVSTPVKAKKKEEPQGTPARKPLIELPPPKDLSQLEKDHEIIKEYVDAYSKQIDPMTGEVSFNILNDEGREEDYVAINSGFGVGASNRQLSLKEKEVEFTRWTTALLSRIPEAPTFEEIGTKNNVFLLRERRERLRRKREEEENMANKKRRTSSMSMKDDEGNKTPTKKKNVGAVERKSPGKKKEEEEKEKKDMSKRMKPLSLVPLPSFYESDLRRTRIVHFDLMTSSIQSSAKVRFEQAQNEYNAAFRTSNALLDRKVSLENTLKQNMQHFEAQYKKLVETYRMSITQERRNWRRQKAEYDANRLKKLMPSGWGAKPTGTQITQAVCNKYREGTIPHTIGTCVADITDVVIMKLINNVQDEPFQPFRPSKQEPKPDNVVVDPNTGETLAQKVQRLQQHYSQEIQQAKMKLANAEEERKKCWKRMEKTKLEMAQQNRSVTPVGQGPPASFTPGRREASRGIESFAPSGSVNTSESKYSVARAKERVHPDGSVEPINKKKGADGLYQRPAGRARKGMDWDPVRGVWVPRS